jgi:hypothetical protein
VAEDGGRWLAAARVWGAAGRLRGGDARPKLSIYLTIDLHSIILSPDIRLFARTSVPGGSVRTLDPQLTTSENSISNVETQHSQHQKSIFVI